MLDNNIGAVIINHGYLGSNFSGLINNTGTINNYDILDNSGNSTNNKSAIENGGTINNECGGTFKNSGTYSGNPVINKCPDKATTKLTSSVNPSVFGKNVTFTAKVTSSSSSVKPTGTIIFKIDGRSQSQVTLSSGQAKLTISTLSVGTHSVSAKYSGDFKYLSSSSNTLTQKVKK